MVLLLVHRRLGLLRRRRRVLLELRERAHVAKAAVDVGVGVGVVVGGVVVVAAVGVVGVVRVVVVRGVVGAVAVAGLGDGLRRRRLVLRLVRGLVEQRRALRRVEAFAVAEDVQLSRRGVAPLALGRVAATIAARAPCSSARAWIAATPCMKSALVSMMGTCCSSSWPALAARRSRRPERCEPRARPRPPPSGASRRARSTRCTARRGCAGRRRRAGRSAGGCSRCRT